MWLNLNNLAGVDDANKLIVFINTDMYKEMILDGDCWIIMWTDNNHHTREISFKSKEDYDKAVEYLLSNI